MTEAFEAKRRRGEISGVRGPRLGPPAVGTPEGPVGPGSAR